MVWNKELKREIPEGWEVNYLTEIADTSSGGTPLSTNQSYYINGEIPWVNSGELNNSLITNTSNYITEIGLKNSSAKLFQINTILVALYGATAGKVSLLKIPACTNQAICAVIAKSDNFHNYLYFFFSNLYRYLVSLSTGSARDNLSQEIIRKLKLTIPPKHLIEQFGSLANPIFDKITLNIRENQQLSSLRDWLLPMLMNGQVRVE